MNKKYKCMPHYDHGEVKQMRGWDYKTELRRLHTDVGLVWSRVPTIRLNKIDLVTPVSFKQVIAVTNRITGDRNTWSYCHYCLLL